MSTITHPSTTPVVDIMTSWNTRRLVLDEIARLTHRSVGKHIRAFAARFPTDPITAFSPLRLEAWIAIDLGHLTPESRNAYCSTYRTFWRWAVVAGLTDDNPWLPISRARKRERLPRSVTPELAADILAVASDRARTMILLGLHCGLRVAEIAGLHRESWDRANGTLIVTGKGSRDRVIPVPPECTAGLEAWCGGVYAGPMWASQRNGAKRRTGITPGTVARVMLEASWLVGAHVTSHQWRHTFALTHALAGTPMPILQRLLGHASLASTEIYLNAAGLDLRAWTLDNAYLA